MTVDYIVFSSPYSVVLAGTCFCIVYESCVGVWLFQQSKKINKGKKKIVSPVEKKKTDIANIGARFIDFFP